MLIMGLIKLHEKKFNRKLYYPQKSDESEEIGIALKEVKRKVIILFI